MTESDQMRMMKTGTQHIKNNNYTLYVTECCLVASMWLTYQEEIIAL